MELTGECHSIREMLFVLLLLHRIVLQNSLYFNGGLVGTTKMARGIVSVLAVAPSVLSEVVFNSMDLERLLLDTKFCHAISKAGVQRIRCLGFVGCLCGMRGWEDAPDEIKQLIFYEQTERERQILRM